MSESIWDDPRITSYALGEMSDHECKSFEIEINRNPELAAAVNEARALTSQLTEYFESESVGNLDATRRAVISGHRSTTPDPALAIPLADARVATPRTTELDGKSSSWRPLVMVVAIAASLLLLVGVAPWLYRLQQENDISVVMKGQSLESTMLEDFDSARFTSPTVDAEAPRVLAPVMVGDEVERQSLAFQGQATPESVSELSTIAVAPADPASTTFGGAVELRAGVVVNRELNEYSATAESAIAGRPLDVRFKKLADSRNQSAAATPAAASEPAQRDEFSAANGPARPMNRGVESARLERRFGVPTDGRQDALDDFGVVEELSSQAGGNSEAKSKYAYSFLEQEVAESVADTEVLQRSRGAMVESTDRPELLGETRSLSVSTDRVGVEVLSLETKSGLESDYALAIDEGRGPDISGDKFEPITDNAFLRVDEQPLSTFSVDVDTASYSKVRDFLMRANQLPRPDAVRIEELLNYFTYAYEPPADSAEHPFAARVNVTSCPWNPDHRLARVALKGKTMVPEDRPQCNLVFLIDTSGSMDAANKLPLVIEGMQLLLKQLKPDDKVAIVVYAGSAGLVLDSTPMEQEEIVRKALTELAAGGSTNGGEGIALAYQTARDHFITEGVNRVILCTDGDFNVGTTSTDELVRMVEQEAKGDVFLSVLGFGMGNHNDAMLEQISGRGNGNYAFIDSLSEAHKVFVEQTNGTLVTIAKDVKLQIEFNPRQVSAYRLIGYENRVLAKEDFNDDTKDAGEIGAGHAVTALYEIVPAGVEVASISPKVDDLKYQQATSLTEAASSKEMMTLKLRYKEPDGDTSKLFEFPVVDEEASFDDADDDVRFAAAVASFGMQLRRSPHAGDWSMSDVMNTANRAKGEDRDGLRNEFITLVQKASELMGEE